MSPLLRQKIYWDEWWTLGFSIRHAFHVPKSRAKLLKSCFACACLQKGFYLRAKLALNSARLDSIFHHPIIYLWKTIWQFITLQLLKSLTLTAPHMRDHALQVNVNSLAAFVDLPCEPVAMSLFPFVRTAFFLPTGMENRRHPVAPLCRTMAKPSWGQFSVFHQLWARSLPWLSFLQNRGANAFTGGQEGSCPFPPGWSSLQLFVSIDQMWVRIAVFT